MDDTLDMLEELSLEASLRQEEIKRWMAKYYNTCVKERNFKNGDLVLRRWMPLHDKTLWENLTTTRMDLS